MEGLEITIRPLSEVLSEHLFLRLDSEFCQRAFLRNLALIRKWPAGWTKLGDELADISGGATPLGADYLDEGVKFLRVQNVMPNHIEPGDLIYISAQDDADIARSRLRLNDVLLTITGVSYGKSAVVTAEYVGGNINQHSVRMELKRGKIRPLFLSTFLNSAAGKAQSDQNVTGGTRPALDYTTIRSFSIPLLSWGFQSQIELTVQNAHQQLEHAAALLAAAEQTLLHALGLDTWQPPEPLTYVRRASEVAEAARFDSVYFSPAKTESAGILSRGGAKQLSAYLEPIRDVVAPEDVGTSKRVLNFDVGAAAQPVIDDTSPSVEDFESAKKRFQPGDVIISRLRHYLRQIAVIRTDAAAVALGSSEFIVLRPRSDALPQEALVLFLRCLPVQTILKYSQDGSHHPRFSEEDLLAIPVPDSLLSLAPKLTAAVRAAHTARREAQALLARAQRAVEVAIEQGESAAMALLS